MSDSVRLHRRQPTRLPCPWDSPGKNTGVGCHFLLQCMKVKRQSEVAQLCPTLRNPMDCSLPGSSVHGIFQARVLEWGAIAFSVRNAKSRLLINIKILKSPRMTWKKKTFNDSEMKYIDQSIHLIFNIDFDPAICIHYAYYYFISWKF